jgi:hypothetical protein
MVDFAYPNSRKSTLFRRHDEARQVYNLRIIISMQTKNDITAEIIAIAEAHPDDYHLRADYRRLVDERERDYQVLSAALAGDVKRYLHSPKK